MDSSAPRSYVSFHQASTTTTPPVGPHVTFAIRKDALHATDGFNKKLAQHTGQKMDQVHAAVESAYADWGRDVLVAFSRHIDYEKYGFGQGDDNQGLNVQFYPAKDLGVETIANAQRMVALQARHKTPALLISLDDMISMESGHGFAEMAFSRLFDLDGHGYETGYVARPGHPEIPEQLAIIKDKLAALRATTSNGQRIPIVLLEDNVRRAKMLNWAIDLMEDHGVFENGRLAGISTSFCHANEEERAKIVFEEKPVPISAVVDCDVNCVVDVATTRDLLFDGFVTRTDGLVGRLPGIFMDVVDRFKIAPDRADEFRRDIVAANIRFCDAIEKQFRVQLPLAWFDGGPIIAKVANCPIDAPMVNVLRRMNGTQPTPVAAANDDAIPHRVRMAACGVPVFPPLS